MATNNNGMSAAASTRYELNLKLEKKLKEAGLPFESVRVFGALGVSVHVHCLGKDTAQKWSSLLSSVFDKEPKVVETMWEAKKNKGTCLKPTMRHGYLIGLNTFIQEEPRHV